MQKSFDINSQLELYSNVIVGFVVIQGLGFLYQFGNNTTFKDIVQKHPSLSLSLIIIFVCVIVLSLFGNQSISRVLQKRVESGDRQLVRKVFYGKAVAIFFFGAMPIFFVALYGLIQIRA